MRNFSKIFGHSVLLITFTIILLLVFMAPYFYGDATNGQDSKIRKELSGTLDTLIIGSSHTLRSFIPEIINDELDVKSYNLASPLMSMLGRYTLLKKEIERNPVKTVVMDVSYNMMMLDRENLGIEGEIYFLRRLDNPFERLKYSNKAFEKEDYKKIFSDTLQRSANAWSNIFNAKDVEKEITYGYLPVPSNNTTVTLEEVLKIKNTKKYNTTFLESNLDYFDKIINLCKENDIRIILVVTPLADQPIIEYINHDEVFNQYIELAQKYNVEYYDFNLDKKRIELYDSNNAFYDSTHLSDTGAKIFSKRFSQIINKSNQQIVNDEFYLNYNEIKENILNTKYGI